MSMIWLFPVCVSARAGYSRCGGMLLLLMSLVFHCPDLRSPSQESLSLTVKTPADVTSVKIPICNSSLRFGVRFDVGAGCK